MAQPETGDQALQRGFNGVTNRHKVEVLAPIDLTAGDIEIGAVELKDATTDTRAVIGTSGTIDEGDNALAVKDPAVGLVADGAVVTDANGTLSAKLRGLVKILADVWNSVTHTLNVSVYAFSNPGVMTNSDDIVVDATAGGVAVLAANANRKAAIVQNVGAANGRLGTTVATNKGIQLAPGQLVVLEAPWPVQAALKAIRESATSTTFAVAEIV
jgi:hypothetical protein